MGSEPRARAEAPPTALGALAEAVARRYGLSLRACTPEGVEQRLRYRLRDRAFERVEDYAEYLLYGEDAAAWEALLETLTTNDSRFFGDPADFGPLRELGTGSRWRDVAEGDAAPRFRCLSAGSGRGEEAYTLAMALDEARTRTPSLGYEVIGVDVSARALASARAATYGAAAAEALPVEWRERHLEPLGTAVRIGALRARVRFARVNLASPGSLAPLGAFDLIFARDVLTALTPEARRVALGNLEASLKPGGVLLLGPGESIGGSDVALWPIPWGERCAYAAEPEPSGAPAAEEHDPEPGTALVAHRGRVPRAWVRLLLERRGYRVDEAEDGVRALEIAVRGRLRERYFLERALPSRGGRFVADRLARARGLGPGAVTYLAAVPRSPAGGTGPEDPAVVPLPLSERDLDPILGPAPR